jgi:hypothetical protein
VSPAHPAGLRESAAEPFAPGVSQVVAVAKRPVARLLEEPA